MVDGWLLDDDANILLRFGNGAKGVLYASQISIGEGNNLKVFVYGEKGGLEWHQEERFRSLGDGDVDFNAIFGKIAQYDFIGWPALDWEFCLKYPEQGAAEGALFIARRIIRKTEKAFDDFAGSDVDEELSRRVIGIN